MHTIRQIVRSITSPTDTLAHSPEEGEALKLLEKTERQLARPALKKDPMMSMLRSCESFVSNNELTLHTRARAAELIALNIPSDEAIACRGAPRQSIFFMRYAIDLTMEMIAANRTQQLEVDLVRRIDLLINRLADFMDQFELGGVTYSKARLTTLLSPGVSASRSGVMSEVALVADNVRTHLEVFIDEYVAQMTADGFPAHGKTVNEIKKSIFRQAVGSQLYTIGGNSMATLSSEVERLAPNFETEPDADVPSAPNAPWYLQR